MPGRHIRVLAVALLVLLALAGLRGAIRAPRWDGPLHRDGLAIGAVLEFVLITLLAITISRGVRHRGAGLADLGVKLRAVLGWVLSLGIAAVAVIMIIGLHLHLFTAKAPPHPLPGLTPQPARRPAPRLVTGSKAYVIPLNILLYGLLAALLIVAIVLAVRYGARLRPARPFAAGEIAEDGPDAEDLREAVTSGREALLTIDDARAAIIACYLAMERSLAERGTVRTAADTPGELLARAMAAGLITGGAAPTLTLTLTELFYEARFSVHPMDQGQRAVAERVLGELAGALAQPAAAT